MSQIQFQRFEATKSGLFTLSRDKSAIEAAQDQAIRWIETHPEAEIINIDTACASLLTVVTVWYRSA
ncbi:MAG: hypothetical protein KDB27_12130 [Planctomycetales bacterium]|nr:hypothetical protein [Planctomycetales bacterium]